MSTSKRITASGRTFVFLGISGSGKGTQAKFLKRAFGKRARVISTGAAFRSIARRPSFVGRFIRGIMRRGDLVPYWGPAYVWLDDFFHQLRADEHIIFEGAPRRIEEAPMLDAVMHDLGRALPIAIYLRLPARAAYQRLAGRGRFDDNPKAIAARFQFFREHVGKVIRYYQRHGRLIIVDGRKSPEQVWAEIKRKLKLR